MKTSPDRSPPAPGTLVVFALAVLWGAMRLMFFRDTFVPLTYVVPLLVCVWTRRYWHVWTMGALFIVLGAINIFRQLPPEKYPRGEQELLFGVTLFNILVGATVIHAIIALRAKVDRRNARLSEQNAELEAQSEELSQQNEEIRVQAEELAQQNEEIESQSEEFAAHNEELQALNQRIALREEILQGLLESTRRPESGLRALEEVCRRSLHAIGGPAECVAVLRIDPDRLRVKVQAAVTAQLRVPEEWPLAGTIAGVVIEQNRTAYVSDVRRQPEVAAPFASEGAVRSLLATPLRIGGETYGVVVAASSREAHWTQDQFSVIEWVAAQCGLITEGIRWQKALRDRTREVETANRAKDQFLAMLSHELRTPLTPVLAAAGVLEQDDRLPPEVREDLRMIRRNVSIQSRLIDDLLDLTRLGRGKLDLDRRLLDLPALLHETAVIVAPDLDARDQSVELNLHPAEGACVLGDGPRLQQVFWNLLKNAIKFSPAKARIGLTTRMIPSEAPRIAIEITDTGVGIEPADLERIFLPFEQVADGGRQRGSDGGLGLGLAIAKAIVELHHGNIRVHSDGAGRGATFTVELPLAARPANAAPLTNGTRSQFPLADGTEQRRLRILLVEDHGDTGRILARLLRNSGHDVEHAQTATRAAQLFDGAAFDLVISDLGLPDESGIELMRRLRGRRPDLAGICLSGYGMEDDLNACREAGFSEHLTKPVDMQRLHGAIGRVVARLER